MAWTKILLAGDSPTNLTGTAYRTLYLGVAGAVTELAHGALNTVLTSGGAAANPTWAAPSAGAHALDAGQSDVVITTPADNEVLAYDGIGDWINQTPAEAGLMAVGDAPTAHKTSHESGGGDALSGALALTKAVFRGADPGSEIVLTPKISSASVVEGTVFYDSDDNHLYVYVV